MQQNASPPDQALTMPMLAIIGYASSLQHKLHEPDQLRIAREIGTLAEDVLRQMGAPVERSSEPRPEQAEFELGAVLRYVQGRFEPEARSRHLWLEIESDSRLPTLALIGDEVRLRQVLLNLVHNGVKFTHEGGVCLRTRVLALDEERARLRFEVSDTGVGIASTQMPRVAEALAAGRDSVMGVTGLGLMLCGRLVHHMGGEIGVDSEPGRGSTFWIELTLRIAPTVAGVRARLAGHAAGGDIVGAVAARQMPVIDRQIGLKYAAGRPELYDRVLVRFRELHCGDGAALARALASHDLKQAHRLLHSLKGVAAMIGALGLRDEAARLEGLCIAGATHDQLAHDLAGLESQLAEVAAAIDVLRAELQHEQQGRDPRH